MRPTCVTDAGGAVNVLPLGTVISCAKIPGGLLKLHTNGVYDECRLPIRGVKGVLVTIKSFAGYGSNMPLCSHSKGLYDGGSKRLPSPEQYLDLAVMVPKERPVLPPEHVSRLLPPREGSSGLAQETPDTAVGRGSPIQDAGGRVKGRSVHTQTPSEKKSERQRMVREEVAEETLRMKRMRGKPETLMDGDGGGDGECASGKKPTNEEGGTTSKKARRPGGLTIREGQAAGGGDSADPGAAAAREPSGKSKRKVGAEEGDGQKKPRRRKSAEAASGGEGSVGQECDEATAFWLEYERNDVGEIVEKERPVQLFIDPRKVCDIPPWERYYNHRSLSRETVDGIKDAMLSHFREKKIWTKNPLVLAPIYKSVSRRPEQADRVHKDVFKPEDKDKYYYYPVNGQHTVAAVKELEGEQIFDLWKMHSWPARVVWFSDRDFAGYRQVSLNENTRHKMSKQRSQKAAFLDMWEAWENEERSMAIQGNPSGKEAEKQKFFDFQKLILGKSPNGAHWTLAQKNSSLADKDYVAAVGNALRQWMPLVAAGDDVFRKVMEFYAKWAEGNLLGGDGKTPLSRPGKYMPDKSSGLQAISEMGSKGAAGETKMGWLVRVPPPPTKKKTQADDKFFVVVKEPDIFCWQCLADMIDVEKLSILDNILTLRGVFVQSAGDHLKRQHKPGIKDMVATTKVDRVMLRMFHYILFLETEADERVWRYESPFFRTEGRLLEEFGPQGLTKQVWVEMRKHFQGAVEYVNTCKRTLPHEKESLDDAKKLYEDNRFPKSFEKYVRSILRRTEEEVRDTIRVSGDVRHIKWPDLNRVTSLIPFAFPPSQAHSHVTAICEVVRHYVCNLYVLDLCDPTLLTDWREDDFANLQDLLQTLSPTHGALVIFFPSHWELSFLKGMPRLSVHHVRIEKWVRNAQKQSTVREGNMLVEECDRLYVIFNGEKLEDNKFAVYPASSPTKVSRAHGPSPAKHTVADRSKAVCSLDPSGQAVACFDVAEEERFIRRMWEDGGVTNSLGPAYGRWSGIRPVVALEKEAKMIDYLHEFVKARVADTRNACEFVQTTGEQNWDPKRDMYWKLSGNKTTDVWDFLFGPGPPGQTDLEYSRQRNLVFAMLNGYHGAPRESVSHFLRRLEHVYFTLAEPLTLENYKSQFDEDDPFDAEDMEELSDSETFDFESMPLPRVVGQRGEETRHGPARGDVKWLHARALMIGASEEVLHSRSAMAMTREGVIKGGKWTFVQAPVLGDEEPAVEARVHGDEKGGEVTVDIRTDPQRKDGDFSLTCCSEEQGGRASMLSTARGMVLLEAIELGNDSAATELVSDSGVTEMQNVESSVEGGEVAVSINMDPERKDHDSPSTRCGAEQGDRASVLNTGREMVLHEPIDLPSDSAATELVSDTTVAEVQKLESSVDVGAVARQEGEFPQRAPEHGVRSLMSLPMKPLKAVREKRLSGRSLAASPKKSSSVGLFKRVQMPRLSQRAVRVLKACGIDKEEGLRKHLAASIESVTALSDGSDDDGKRGVLKDPCPKYIAKDTFNKRGYNFSGKRADSF
ncbi:hypothetical protein CBR_g30909 [Chara braunii]|uniref:Uncharacterized protein n=1 Tax=Chara braunii TaxID=69332 RepID=A0A388LDR9_CHABU|nr:hypothetical protein CBR_g30909 [Chara braunii]|eukprot:GBG80445.1 hypothetical protein CBR_g30909 [Chara braunii]